MSSTHQQPRNRPVETDAQRRARLAWEAQRIAEARAEVAADLLIPQAEANAWIDSLGSDHPLPIPQPRKRD